MIYIKNKPLKTEKDGEPYFKSRFQDRFNNRDQNRNQNQNQNQNRNHILGIEDEKYFHLAGEPTKKEIRAISISLMGLKKDSVIIDAGCGSGSISIEVSAIADGGIVYAIDRNAAKIENLKKNIEKFQRPNIIPILGELPQIFTMFKEKAGAFANKENESGNNVDNANLLLPDVIFIGGGSKYLEDILTESFHILKNEGVIVVNSILLSSFNNVMSFVNKFNPLGKVKMKYEVIAVNISRLKTIRSDSYFHSLNQIYITKIVKYNNKYNNTGFKFENNNLK